ncbi:hypothetical protein [Streptomyces sp. 2112.2]|uniref:hypothetical protein n=1 Tax=Streptomyces sp. 2112.2 TaxID=1881024 RepID=UPI000B803E1E|nr:hypothetical protein [Streptomyces sp. 2112.2]
MAMHLARIFTDRGRRAERFVYAPGDFDTSRGGRAAVERHAAELAEFAAEYDIPAVVAESGPSGGLHVWMASPEGIEPVTVRRFARAAAALWPTFDGTPLYNPISGALRPPGSAHRHGGRARLRSHTLAQAIEALSAGAPAAAFAALAEALETLAVARGQMAEGEAADPEHSRDVPPSIAYDERGRTRPVVRPVTTDQAGRVRLDTPRAPLAAHALAAVRRRLAQDDDHSAHMHRVLCALAAAGYTYDDAATMARTAEGLEYLRTARTPGGRQPRAEEDQAATLARAWWLAVQDEARTPAAVAQQRDAHDYAQLAATVADLLDRAEAAEAAHWTRQSGPADLTCLRAVAWLMLQSGSAAVSAPYRRIGVLIGYHASTAGQALDRLIRDGWLRWETAPLPEARTAGRVAIATQHECTDDEHHMCALYTLADTDTGEIITPGQPGSDRRRTPPGPPSADTLRSHLTHQLTHAQGGVWHTLGHHHARTHTAIQEGAQTLHQLSQATGYTLGTTAEHIEDLRRVGLATSTRSSAGTRVHAMGRSLWEAAERAEPGTGGRTARHAAAAIVAAYVADWWEAEVSWCRLPRKEKRGRGRRPEAGQQLIPVQRGDRPGVDPRAYPRTAAGAADHRRARILAEARTQAPAIEAYAQQLAQRGQLIDPSALVRQMAADAAAA